MMLLERVERVTDSSAVCSVTDSPPTLLVCLNRGASVWPTFSENRTLCVNTLSAGQEPLSNLFGGKTPMAERFAAAGVELGRHEVARRLHDGARGSEGNHGAGGFEAEPGRVRAAAGRDQHDISVDRRAIGAMH